MEVDHESSPRLGRSRIRLDAYRPRSRPGERRRAPGPHGPTNCSSGAHTLSHFGDHVYPETGNGGYTSLHTDVHMVYDAPRRTSSCPATTSF